MNTIPLTTFRQMVANVEIYRNKNNRKNPKLVGIPPEKKETVTWEQWLMMVNDYNTYKKEMKKEPTTITIPKQSSYNKHPDLIKLQSKFGVIVNSAADLYNMLMKYCKYKYYYNDVYNNKQVLERLLAGKGVNCYDYAQLLEPILKSIGYTVKPEHVKVKCMDDKWYGHILLRISGRGLNNVIFDAVGATKTKYSLGNACCTRGIIHLGWGYP